LAIKNSDLKAKTAQTKVQTSASNNIPTLKDLRNDKQLIKKTSKIKKAIVSDSSSDSDSEKSSDDYKAVSSKAGMTFYKPFPRKKGKKAISGEAHSAKDRVKLDVPWPHVFAQNESVNYNDKEFGILQLVRGEIYILHNVEAKFAKDRQLHLLNLLYLAEKFPVNEIKAFHSEVLRSIERGIKTWTDSFADEKYRTLVSSSGSSKKDYTINRYPVCGTFQSGTCNFPGDHFGKYGDKKLLHSCRKCTRKGKNSFDSTCRHPSKSCTVPDTNSTTG